ncbi:MAG: NADH-quinone oxidoreductase subunit L [Chloroflexota bacterium]|nr:NADH-quinone oxidoreductase subunit L [Chloroflexota bacterium]MDE2941528.1 NADH-quinone oxidoreductase subunit L [Chloroflexota bacterium]MDE3267538.1 NADH-quinone oxidoreductase subunit L [Chloroflexota bacterium]
MTTSGVALAWLAPAACVAAFLGIVILGRYLPLKGVFLSILAILGSFGLFFYVLTEFLASGGGVFSEEWFSVGESTFAVGIIIDELSVLMLGLVTFVALMVQVYSLGYMRSQPGDIGWYFAVHSLFAAAMLALSLADNLLLIYIAWELVGVCSYLLIGFWYERRSAAEAAKKAFVTTRIGDVGLLIGILLLFKETGTFDISAIFHVVEQGGIDSGTLTVSALLIFLGAMGKSAQFPLHVWLPDAMEGPTPVSALIHAATMVVAGVFLVARLYPIFVTSDTAMIAVAVIGLVTALVTAVMALVMTDLKRVLAYSTVSHLGLMMLALGCFGFTAALLHMVAHAFAKALLFLGAGSIAHGTEDHDRPEGARDIRQMGGLYKRMPITSVTFAIGVLSLGGIPLMGGFFSKEEVLLAVLDGRGPVFFVLVLVAALLSALYMARLLFVVVLGDLKSENEHAHESPSVMTGPLALLAALALGSGLLAVGGWWPGFDGLGGWLYFDKPHPYKINVLVMGLSILVAAAGFGLGWYLYGRGVESAEELRRRQRAARGSDEPVYARHPIPARLQEQFSGLHALAVNKFYIDELYQWVIDRVALAFGNFMALFDRVVVNDTGVNGTGRSVELSAKVLRLLETGKVYNYALGMAVGTVVVALIWWLGLPRL